MGLMRTASVAHGRDVVTLAFDQDAAMLMMGCPFACSVRVA